MQPRATAATIVPDTNPSCNNLLWHSLNFYIVIFFSSASKPKYTFDFSEEEADEEENGDNDAASSPVRSYKDDFTPSEPKDNYNNNDFDDDDNEDSYSSPKRKTT